MMGVVPKVERKQFSDEVAAYLREAIMAGEFAAGESIRAEAIGELLSVSATPVREALQSLKAEGFLNLVARKGFTVAPLVPQDIRDLFVAHALIGGELAARAAVQASTEQISELEALHHELMAAAHRGDLVELERKNHHFHRMVYQMADSKRLHWSLGVFAKYVPRRFYSQIEGWPQTTAADHLEVIEAISGHDAERARSAMAAHIRRSGELLVDHFGRNSQAASR